MSNITTGSAGQILNQTLNQIVFSLDMDGCLFGLNETLREVLLRNAPILWDMYQKVIAGRPARVRLALGSNRQSDRLDKTNSCKKYRGRISRTPSAFITMELMTSALEVILEKYKNTLEDFGALSQALEASILDIFQKLSQKIDQEHPHLSSDFKSELFNSVHKDLELAQVTAAQESDAEGAEQSTSEISSEFKPESNLAAVLASTGSDFSMPEVFLDRFLMADLWSQLPDGQSWFQALTNTSAHESHFDGSKVSLLFAQIHRAVSDSNGQTAYHFYDDRLDILSGLASFYSKERYAKLLPSNVMLHLNQYAGDASTNYSTRLHPTLLVDGLIQGLGNLETDYRQMTFLLINTALLGSIESSRANDFSFSPGELINYLTEVPHFKEDNFSSIYFDLNRTQLLGKHGLERHWDVFFARECLFNTASFRDAFWNIALFLRYLTLQDSSWDENALTDLIMALNAVSYFLSQQFLKTLSLASDIHVESVRVQNLTINDSELKNLREILLPYFGGEDLFADLCEALLITDVETDAASTRALSSGSVSASFLVDKDLADDEIKRDMSVGSFEEMLSQVLPELSALRKKGWQLFREGFREEGGKAIECAMQIQVKLNQLKSVTCSPTAAVLDLAQGVSDAQESKGSDDPGEMASPPAVVAAPAIKADAISSEKKTQVLQECVALLNQARPVLEAHRGFGKVLNVLLNVFTGLLTGLIAPIVHRCVTGHWSFKSVVFKTDSAKHIDDLANKLGSDLKP